MHRRPRCRSRYRCRRRSSDVVVSCGIGFTFSQLAKPFLGSFYRSETPRKTPHGGRVGGLDWLSGDLDSPLVWTDRLPHELGAWPDSMLAPEPRRNRRLPALRDFGDVSHCYM